MTKIRIFIGSALLVFLIALAVQIWVDRSTPVTVTIAPALAEDIRVSVSGAVATPGMVTVPSGSRLQDIAEAAGGFTGDADYSSLNLAGRVGDGEHVVIPGRSSDISHAGATAPADGLVDLNSANEAQLDQLPGIGEVLSARIVEHRELNGPFASVDEITAVNGISERLLEELRPYITVLDGN